MEIRIATAIFPTLSLLNHSCRPNTSLVFSSETGAVPSGSDLSADLSESVADDRSTVRGVTATVRAAKVIAPGQEILHCYGKKMWHFAESNECRCFQFAIIAFHLVSSNLCIMTVKPYLPSLRSP